MSQDSVLQRRFTLSELLDLESFGEVVKGFVDLYRVGIKLFDEKGAKLADVKVGNAEFCGYVFQFSDGRKRCTATVGRVKDGPLALEQGARLPLVPPSESKGLGKSALTVPCFTGLRYVILPVSWEGDALGRIVFGPFLPEDLKDFPPSTLTEIDGSLDIAKVSQLLTKVRKAPESTVVKVIVHFAQLLQTMLHAGQKVLFTSQLYIESTREQNRELEDRNRRLEENNGRLKELDRLKSAFLATVSHELRTPLTSIIGYSEMLSEGLAGALTNEQGEYVKTIMDKGETLLKLISSILDISQIEAGKVRLSLDKMNVLNVVAQSVASIRPQAQKKGVVLEERSTGSMPLIHGDPDRLRQVFVNLLANALKFTPKNGKVSVTVTPVEHQPDLSAPGFRVIVEDTGIGIAADQFERIFQSFYQVDSSSTREYGGAGLGLAIVKSFVEGHGGVVRVASELKRGSRFVVILPSESAAKEEVHIAPPIASLDSSDRF